MRGLQRLLDSAGMEAINSAVGHENDAVGTELPDLLAQRLPPVHGADERKFIAAKCGQFLPHGLPTLPEHNSYEMIAKAPPR